MTKFSLDPLGAHIVDCRQPTNIQPIIAGDPMRQVKWLSGGLLLLLGFWCLGRAVEMSLNRDPHVQEKRETVTAGILLGLPATAGGSWLLWAQHRQRRQQAAQRLRNIFFHLVQTRQGQVTPLQFAMAAQIDGDIAKAYLDDRSLEFDATFDVDEQGHMTYCFHLGDSQRQPLPAEMNDI